MAVFTAIAAVAAIAGLGLAVYSTIQQREATDRATEAQAAAISEQRRAEALRKQAMDLDATRRRREVVRNQVYSMARAEATATNQGAEFGSVLPGAFGGISGRSGVNELGINQNQELGGAIFDTNMRVSQHYETAARAGGDASMAAGLGSLGGMLLNNYRTIGQVGSWFAPSTA